MPAAGSLVPDLDQIEIFVEGLFRRALHSGYVSLRAFYDDASNKTFRIRSAALADGLLPLIVEAEADARRAANSDAPIVFCPPLAVFKNNERARESDIAQGLALSIECDRDPERS